MIALLDCDAFYANCERCFIPALNGKPLVVLSNNSGCAIARTEEAKALGIKMGQPYHEFRYMEEVHGLVTLAPNFALYGDMSERVFSVAAGLGHPLSIYSIDECFIGLDGIKGDLRSRALAVRERILKWVGIPCGVGIGKTHTLAKFSNRVAKQAQRNPGSYPSKHAQVCDLSTCSTAEIDDLLEATPVADIWGVGRKLGEQLADAGVVNALSLARMDPGLVRRRWSVVLERTVLELRGISCIDLDNAPAARQQIAHTRSFGSVVCDLPPLIEAVTEFATKAAVKLRRQGSLAGHVHVFVATSPFRKSPQYSRSITVQIPQPTCDTLAIAQAAIAGMRAIYAPGYEFARAGVILQDLSDGGHAQLHLDLSHAEPERRDRSRLMLAVDSINQRFGTNAVTVASSGVGQAQRTWVSKQKGRTPEYTTKWCDLPIVKA